MSEPPASDPAQAGASAPAQAEAGASALSLNMLIFIVANCYFVFQGVILTIVGHGAQNLKPGSSWFLFNLSILVVLVNLYACIQIAIKYIDAKVSQICKRHDHHLYLNIYVVIYAAIYIIIFLGFAAVVLVG